MHERPSCRIMHDAQSRHAAHNWGQHELFPESLEHRWIGAFEPRVRDSLYILPNFPLYFRILPILLSVYNLSLTSRYSLPYFHHTRPYTLPVYSLPYFQLFSNISYYTFNVYSLSYFPLCYFSIIFSHTSKYILLVYSFSHSPLYNFYAFLWYSPILHIILSLYTLSHTSHYTFANFL